MEVGTYLKPGKLIFLGDAFDRAQDEKVIFVELQIFVRCAKSRQCASLTEKNHVRNQETLRGDGKNLPLPTGNIPCQVMKANPSRQ